MSRTYESELDDMVRLLANDMLSAVPVYGRIRRTSDRVMLALLGLISHVLGELCHWTDE